MLDLICLLAITCQGLTTPVNGVIQYTPSSSAPYDFGTIVSYQCNTGFGLIGGDATRSCGGDGSSPNGVWSGTPPTCQGMLNDRSMPCNVVCLMCLCVVCSAITCSSLSSISNGVIDYSPDVTSPYNFGTVATHTCNEGFYLQGSNARTCSGDGSSVSGMWSGSAPVCAGKFTQVLFFLK